MDALASIRNTRYKYSIARREGREVLKELEEMPGVPSHCRYSAREFIYNQYSSDSNTLYVLLDGVVKLYTPYKLGKSLVRLVGPWELFGGLCLLNDHPYKGWAEAFTDCQIIKLPKSSLYQAIRLRPQVALSLVTLQEFQLLQHQALLECLWQRETKTRLARLLLFLASSFGESRPSKHLNLRSPLQINLRLTQQELAEMIATTRESVTTAIKKLHHKNLIEMSHQRIVILDFRELAEHADDP